MKWTKYSLETTTEAVDLISDMLSEMGIEGIEIHDKIPLTAEDLKTLFVDFPPELGEDDGKATVNFYTDPDEDSKMLLQKVRDGLKELSEFIDIGSGALSVSDTEDKDWMNSWKQFFKPFRIDDTIVIKPTWETLAEAKETDLVIEIDPGTSFGTGSHETTKLCILALKKYMKDNYSVLDAGSGSGILSIIAKKLGAVEVLGIDIDPLATSSAIENSGVNKLNAGELFMKDITAQAGSNQTEEASVASKEESKNPLNFITGNIIEDKVFRDFIGKERFDLVVANILADVIIPLSGIIGENLKPGGIFICSGIIDTKEEAVRTALLKNKFNVLETNRMGDWVSFVVKK